VEEKEDVLSAKEFYTKFSKIKDTPEMYNTYCRYHQIVPLLLPQLMRLLGKTARLESIKRRKGKNNERKSCNAQISNQYIEINRASIKNCKNQLLSNYLHRRRLSTS
jgi:hypothetical protein